MPKSIIRKHRRLPLTFPRYRRFGTKLALFFGLAKIPKYKTISPSRPIPKSLVACVVPSVFSPFQFSRFNFRFRFRTVFKSEVLFNFYVMLKKIYNWNKNRECSIYREFEYWFDNLPWVSRNFFSLVSLWIGLIIAVQSICFFFLVRLFFSRFW